MALPSNLPLLDYASFGSPLLPAAKSSINLGLLDFAQFGSPFAANNTVSSTLAWIKVAGVWKQATVWIKVAGVWKTATPYIKVSGTWK